MSGLRWIDNHCHLPVGPDAQTQVDDAAAAGVVRLIDVGTDRDRSRQALANAEDHPGVVFATAGVHPHDAVGGIDGIVELLDDPRVVAVGECGLDFHYDHSPRPVQRQVFASHIALAHEHGLPLVIHTREAWDDTFAVLDAEGTPSRTVFHCFTGGPADAEAALARGGVLSFSGIVTFKNADEVRAALALTPLDRILIETDSPYLAPVPMRGKPNQPANLPYVAGAIARVLDVELATFAERVWDTTHEVYGLPRLSG